MSRPRRPSDGDQPREERSQSRLAGTLHATTSVDLPPAPGDPAPAPRKHAPRGYSAGQLGGGGSDAAMNVGVWRMAARNAARDPQPDLEGEAETRDTGARQPRQVTGPLDHPISAPPPKRPPSTPESAPPPKRPTEQSTAPSEEPGAPEDEQ